MKASDLFNRIADAWPTTVDISKPEPTSDGGVWFPNLAKISREIEDSIDYTEDHWGSLACWAFYQTITAHAATMYSQGVLSLAIHSIPLEFFHKRVVANLEASGWEDEKNEYLGL
jgi:hypothetical protein